MTILFAWDELSGEIQPREPQELAASNYEGGWTGEGWVEGLPDETPVEIRTTGRHYALETWCNTPEEAHERFMKFRIYKECQE